LQLVARISNKFVTAQIVSAEIVGDKVICAAYSSELPRYGIDFGLTNYSAAYCTGLLLARRLLKKLKMDEEFKGNEECGKDYLVEEEEDKRRPFKCILDVGLKRTTTGAKVFAVMKGVCDGGIYVPHGESRFAGATKEGEIDEGKLRDRILGKHVSEYMKYLSKEDPETYKKQFSKFIEKKITPEMIEGKYLECHKKIRENPEAVKAEKVDYSKYKEMKIKKLSLEERKARLAEKKAKLGKK